jgi:hypothetical protein
MIHGHCNSSSIAISFQITWLINILLYCFSGGGGLSEIARRVVQTRLMKIFDIRTVVHDNQIFYSRYKPTIFKKVFIPSLYELNEIISRFYYARDLVNKVRRLKE